MCAIQRNFNQQPNYGGQNYNPQQNNPREQQLQQDQPQPRYRFRWALYAGVPLVIFLFFWFVSGLDFAFGFSGISQALGIVFANRFMLLTCLGILSVITLLIIKAYRK